MLAACLAEAEQNGWKVTIAIVDDAGVPLSLERMDGAPAISATVAPEKAKASALTKQPTKFWEDRVKERPAFANFSRRLADPGRRAGDPRRRVRRRDRRLRRAVEPGRADRPRRPRGAEVTPS